MKRFLMLLLCAVPLFCHATNSDVVIDKENCTITKYGKTFPLYGTVRIVESGNADLYVKVVDWGSCDLEVKLIESSSTNNCGEWNVVDWGASDFTIRIYDWGSCDLEVKFIDWGNSGFYR